MAKLVEATREAGAKLILVGDARQLQPIEAGGAFENIGQAELREITRQRDERDRENVRRFASGDAREALTDYALRGMLTIGENRREAMRDLIVAWKEVGVKNPHNNLIIAGTNLESTVLNRMAQEERRTQGKLGDARIKFEKEYFHENDRILFTRNSTPLGVKNGDLGTVLPIDPIGRALYVKLDGGEIVHVPLKTYHDVKLGYSITTHKGQGVTVEGNVYALVGGPMQDRELSYVQASRARGETRLFTDKYEAGKELTGLAKQMSTSRQKDLAHDHLPLDVQPGPSIELQR